MKDTMQRKSDKIRVGFICDQLEIGGQERACYRILQHLDRERFIPYLYAFRPGMMLEDFFALQIPIYLGHTRPGRDKAWNTIDRLARIDWRKRLTHLLQNDRIDVVVVFSWRDGPAAARVAGVRAIVERVDGPALAERINDKSGITRVVCESRSVYHLLTSQRKRFGLTKKQVKIVLNGIDRNQFNPGRLSRRQCRKVLGIAHDEFVVGTVARLAPVKNIGTMVRAIAFLMCQNSNILQSKLRFIVVGPDGGEHKALQGLARELGISNKVTFLGMRTDIPEILRALDLFVSTSINEGTPNAMLEAMAMALPVIATPVGGVTDLIDRRYLISPNNYQLLAKKILKLWQEPLLRKRLGKQNRQKSAQYEITDAARKFEQILIEAIGAGQRGPALARRLLFISSQNGLHRLTQSFADQLKKEKVNVKYIRLHDRKSEDRLILQQLHRISDPDLLLVEDVEIAKFVKKVLPHIEIVFLQQDNEPLLQNPKKYAAVDHILFYSELSAAAAQNDFPFLVEKILPGSIDPTQKNLAAKLAGLLEQKSNNRQPEGL